MFSVLALFTLCCCKQWLFIRNLSPTELHSLQELVSDFRNFFGVHCSIGRDIANITVLRILYSDCLLRSTSLWLWCVCRNRLFTWPFVTHLDCNVFIFPQSKYSTHPSTLVIKNWYLPDSGRHVTSVHHGLSQPGTGEEPGYEVDKLPISYIKCEIFISMGVTAGSERRRKMSQISGNALFFVLSQRPACIDIELDGARQTMNHFLIEN